MRNSRLPVLPLLLLWWSPAVFGGNDEEAVNLADTETVAEAPPSPYEVTRNSLWIWLPVATFTLISAHLIAYPYLRIKKAPDLGPLLPSSKKSSEET